MKKIHFLAVLFFGFLAMGMSFLPLPELPHPWVQGPPATFPAQPSAKLSKRRPAPSQDPFETALRSYRAVAISS